MIKNLLDSYNITTNLVIAFLICPIHLSRENSKKELKNSTAIKVYPSRQKMRDPVRRRRRLRPVPRQGGPGRVLRELRLGPVRHQSRPGRAVQLPLDHVQSLL